MKKQLFRVSIVVCLNAMALWAAGFWDKKAYTDWSDKEVSRVLSNSPWAQKVTIYMGAGAAPGGGFGGGRGGGRRGGGGGFGGGGPGGGAGGGGFGGPGGGGPGGDGGFGGPGAGGPGGGGPPPMTVFVRWFSSLPIKQAMVKVRFGGEVGAAKEAQDYLAKEELHYIVSASGLPARMGNFVQQNPDMLKQNTVLKRKKKEPINPEDIQVRTQEQIAEFFFLFPKTDQITLEDKDVEFEMKTQRFEIKRKFKLKNMVYQGELSL